MQLLDFSPLILSMLPLLALVPARYWGLFTWQFEKVQAIHDTDFHRRSKSRMIELLGCLPSVFSRD